jgi:hypothetical protein
MKKSRFAILLCLGFMTSAMAADEQEEFLVSTVRTDKTVVPGASLKRPADFLLQRIRISNDTREEKPRKEEVLETLRLLLNAAAKDKGIELALLADYRTVVPLKLEVAALRLTHGNRADTSELTICIKTKVVPGASNAAALFAKLKEFPSSVKPAGRSAVDAFGEIEVTIVNPAQYREPVIRLYAADSKLVTSALGPDYRVVTKGIDRQLQWLRDGLVDVIVYIPYEYDVIPSNVTSYPRIGN